MKQKINLKPKKSVPGGTRQFRNGGAHRYRLNSQTLYYRPSRHRYTCYCRWRTGIDLAGNCWPWCPFWPCSSTRPIRHHSRSPCRNGTSWRCTWRSDRRTQWGCTCGTFHCTRCLHHCRRRSRYRGRTSSWRGCTDL